MSEQNKTIERPLSPHLQVYRLPMAAKMSISHRITGVILTFGLVLISAAVIAAGLGADVYNQAMALIQTPVTKLFFTAWAFVLFYHMGNGLRHLFWDMGKGISEKAARTSGILVLIFATVMTVGIWCCATTDVDVPEPVVIEEAE
jgi:succinate dehydrogenase / fumarate reductase cytochrome b subunit